MKIGLCGPIVIALAGLLLPTIVSASDSEWTTHRYMNDIYDIEVTEDGVWCASDGGALFYNFDSDDLEIWHRNRNGLASDTLTSVSQLSDGRIAFGTVGSGVSVYNRDNGIWYNYNSSVWSLADNAIRFIREDGLWRIIGTPKGFSAFYNNGDSSWNKLCQEGIDFCDLPGWDIRCGIFFDGYIWLGAWSGNEEGAGVARLNYNNPAATPGTYDTADDGLTSLDIREFAVWNDQLYCLSQSAVSLWDGQQWVTANTGLPEVSDRIGYRDINSGSSRLYVAVSGESAESPNELLGGIFYLDPGETTWARLGSGRFHSESVAEGSDGVVWVGTVSRKLTSFNWYSDHNEIDGLWEYVGETWIQHRHDGPDVVSTYRDIGISESGVLWCASAANGRGWQLMKNDHSDWSTYTEYNSQISNYWILNLTMDGENLWLGHCCYQNLPPLDYWISDTPDVTVYHPPFNIYSSARDQWDNIWFGSWYEAAAEYPEWACGLHHWNNSSETLTAYTNESTGGLLVSNSIAALTTEGSNLWIGYMDSGVSRVKLNSDGSLSLDSSDWTHLTYNTLVLASDAVTALESRPGEVWIGTSSGLSIWKANDGLETWEVYRSSYNQLPGSQVTDIALTDTNGWIGIAGHGVTRMSYDNPTEAYEFTTYTTPEVVNPNVRVVLAGNQGEDIWVGTENGLSYYTPGISSEIETVENLEVYPNPYKPICGESLYFKALPGAATSGVIVDVSGRIVHRFDQAKVSDSVLWKDGRDLNGNLVAPGLYVVKVSTPQGWLTGNIAVIDFSCD